MARALKDRLYQKRDRWYADFRDFADVIPAAESKSRQLALGTADPAEALNLAARRLEEFRRRRRELSAFGGAKPPATLADFALLHLTRKRQAGSPPSWLAQQQLYLERAADYFGADRPLMAIEPRDVVGWVEQMRTTQKGIRGGAPTGQTLRHHLNALSNLYRRARAENVVAGNYNPAAAMMPADKPKGAAAEASWLEINEAAWLLAQAARGLQRRPDLAPSGFAALLATLLLTGARKAEILGLEVEDVSFDRRTITLRPNAWRPLKTPKSRRTVPLWPQLEEILRAYIFPLDRTPRSGLLFPRRDRGQGPAMITNFDGSLDQLAVQAGWRKGEIRSKMFRHTYASARLQSLDQGAPVSPYTVSRELGHGSLRMIERVYAHLGVIRQRSEVFEYRSEKFPRYLGPGNKESVTGPIAETAKSLQRS